MSINLLVMDVDGTLTDGKIYMGPDGECIKRFDIKDGYGIKNLLIPAGITPVIITGRRSKITEQRGKELSIKEIHQGVSDKTAKLEQILCEKKLPVGTVAYIGDDLNDLPCMRYVKDQGGIIGCPSDAAQEVISIADFVSSKKGGDGAVREFIEWLLTERNPKL